MYCYLHSLHSKRSRQTLLKYGRKFELLIPQCTQQNNSVTKELEGANVKHVLTEEQIRRRKWISAGCGLFVGSVLYFTFQFVSPAFRKICLPYLPATPQQLDNLVAVLKKDIVSKSSRNLPVNFNPLIDLGSGDGRVLFHLAQNKELGIKQLMGIELNRPLVFWSIAKSFKYKKLLKSRHIEENFADAKPYISFRCKDMWKYDLSTYRTIVIFGAESLMDQLEIKFEKELQPGTTVVTCRFPMPNWKPNYVLEAEFDSIYLYHV